MKPEQAPARSKPQAWIAPSFRCTTAAVDGHSRSGVIVATMMQSTAVGEMPRTSRQRRAVGTIRSDVPPTDMKRRSANPVQERIYASVVSSPRHKYELG